MSPEVYRDFVGSAVSRRKFRDFLVKEGTVGALDCDWDGKVVEELAGQIRSASQGIYGKFTQLDVVNTILTGHPFGRRVHRPSRVNSR